MTKSTWQLQINPMLPWVIDATLGRMTGEAFNAMPWEDTFSQMEALEAGAISNPDEQRLVGHYWLRDPSRAPTIELAEQIGATSAEVIEVCQRIQMAEEFTHALVLGIGGSNLGPAFIADALGETTQGLVCHFIDNIDPDGLGRTLTALGDDLRHTVVVVTSKSGGTVETMTTWKSVRIAQEAIGIDPLRHTIAISVEGSSLWHATEGALARCRLWDFVGGRTSATSAVGLVILSLLGHDAGSFLAGARDMDEWTRCDRWEDNPAAILAACWYEHGHGRGDRNLVILPYRDRLQLFGRYLQQLVMESIGKRHDLNGQLVEQGLTVYGNKGSTDQHAFVQQLVDGRDDCITHFIAVDEDERPTPLDSGRRDLHGDNLQAFMLGTRATLAARNRPSITITLHRMDPYSLGGLIALFERAVGLYGSMIAINPYHQPGVEAGKIAASERIKRVEALKLAVGRMGSCSIDELAKLLNCDELELWYLARRLVATGRLRSHGFGEAERFSVP